jgi:type VI secretion system secreted protein Hcp
MKIPTIDGESQSDQFRDYFEVYSFSWGVSQGGTQASGGGGGAGKVSVSDISFMKSTGKASPKLFLHCCQGTHFPSSAVVVTRIVDGREEVYLEYKLENVMISSYQTSGDGGSVPTESLSLNFTKITYRQAHFLPNGGVEFETNFFDFARGIGG